MENNRAGDHNITVLVCGGRDFSNVQLLRSALDIVHATYTVAKVIHGDASGADSLADTWANDRGKTIRSISLWCMRKSYIEPRPY